VSEADSPGIYYRSKKGDYVLALKENHPEVYAEVRDCFDAAPREPGYTEVTKDHGRIEKWEAWLDTDVFWFAGREAWAGLAGIWLYPFHPDVKGLTSVGTRYFLARLTDTAQFARSVRSHGGRERTNYGLCTRIIGN
jgi:hypothetical protein